MKRCMLFVLASVFLFLLAGGCSAKEECSADTDCAAGYVCGEEQKCEKLSVTLLFQGITDGQVLTVADDKDKSDKTIQINITVAAQATVGSVRDGMPVTLDVTRSSVAENDDDTLAIRGLMTRTYAGILVNGFAKFLHVPFEEGEHQVRAYIPHSPEIATPTLTVTATYEVAQTLVMRYYKAGTVPTMLEGAALDDADDLDKNAADFQVKMEAVTTGYTDGQVVEVSIDNYGAKQTATVQDGVAAFPSVNVPIREEITMRVKAGEFEDTLAFSAVSQQTCAFALNIENDQKFGKKDDENGALSGLQKTLVISDVTQCSLGSSVKIYINKTPGTDTPDHTLSLGGDTLERSITLPESADAEDFHTVTVVIEDDDTSLTGSKSVTGLFVDITAPAAPTVTGTTPTTDTAPEWSWDTPADTVGFRYSFDEIDWTETTDTSYTPQATLVDGAYTLFVQASDEIGNWSESGSFTITIDTTAPAAPKVTGTTPTNDTTPTWSWDTPEDTVEFRYSYDETNWTLTTDTSFTPGTALAEGTYTLFVQGRDDLGNWSESGSFTITIDTTPPAAPAVTGTTPTNDTTPTWSWNTPAGTVEFRYSDDETNWTTTTDTSFAPAAALAEGPHTLFVQGRDAAGNWSGSGSFAITVDTTPPAAPTVLATTPTNDTTPTWSWDTPADTVGFRYSFTDGSGWTTTTDTSFTPTTALAEGTYTLFVQGRDAAGNWSPSGSRTVVVDLTAPDAPEVSGTTPTNDTTPEWTWGAVTGADLYRYSFDESNWTTTDALSFTPTDVLPEGDHTLFVQARNDLGNWSGSGFFTITVDTTPPDAPTVGGITPTSNKRPTWNWDTPTGTVEFRRSYNEIDWTVLSGTSFTPGSDLPDGVYRLYVQGRDLADNWSESGWFDIEIDTEGPTIDISAPSAAAAKTGDMVAYTITYSGAETVTLTAGDITLNTTGTAGGSVAVSGTGATTRTVTITDLTGDGTIGISITAGTASDAALNFASAAGPSATFAVDNTGPTVVIDPVSPCTRRTTGTMTFAVTGATTVTCRFDKPGGTFVESACDSSYDYTLDAGNGTYTLTVSASDEMNNTGGDTASIDLDATTPTFQWHLPPNNTPYRAGSTVPSFVFRSKNFEAGETVEIWDADANVKVAEKTTAGSLCNATEDVSILLDLPDKCGLYTLYAKVTDSVGAVTYYTNNTTDAGSLTSRTYTFDRYVPVIESFTVTNDANGDDVLLASEDLDGIPGNGLQATIVLTVEDDIDIGRTATLRNKTTGNSYTAVVAGDRTATFTSITIPEGLNSFAATLTDCGGNTSDEFGKTLTIDTAPPTVIFQGPTGATPGHPLWLTARDGVVDVNDKLTGQELKFKITGDWDGATPVVKHTVYDYADVEQSSYTYAAGEMTVDGNTVTIALPPLAYNKHKFEVTVEDTHGNARIASRTYEVDPITPNAVIAYPTDELVLDASKDEDLGASGVQFTMRLDLTKLQTPTGTASTIDILAIPITALGGVEDGTRSRKSWNGFTATLDGPDQVFPNDGSYLRLGDGFWRLTVKVTDDHSNVYDTATLLLGQQIDVEVDTTVACSTLYLEANDKPINGRQVAPTWLNSADGDGTYDMYVATDAPDGSTVSLLINGTTTYNATVAGGIADLIGVVLATGGVENTLLLTVDNGVAVATDTYYVRADVTDPTLSPSAMSPVPHVTGSLWELGYGYDDDIDHDTAAILELDGSSAGRLIFTIGGIEDIVGYPMHGAVTLTAVAPAGAIGGTTTVNIAKVGSDMVAEFTNLSFNDSVAGGQTDIEMKVTVTEQPSGNVYEKTIFVHVNLDRPEPVTPVVTTVPARGSAFVQWTAIVGNTSPYAGPFQNRPYEYQVKYEQYGGTCSLDDSESVFDTGVAVIPLADFSVADPSLNGDDFVDPKAAGEAQSYRFYLKKRENTAKTVTADIHRDGDKYCFAVRASDAVYAQDGTILATNRAPILSTNVVDKGAVELSQTELIAAANDAQTHPGSMKYIGDLNGDGITDFVFSDVRLQTVSVFISSVGAAPAKVDLTKPGDAGANFGLYVSSGGDFNGDGYLDILVYGATNQLHLFTGTANSINTTRIGSMITTSDAISDVAAVGDFNGDGIDDFAVGQNGYSGNTGKVDVFFGSANAADLATVDVTYYGANANDRFGSGIRKAGNLNGDLNGTHPLGDFIAGTRDTPTKVKVFYGSATPAGGTVAYDFNVYGNNAVRKAFYGRINGDTYDDLAIVSTDITYLYKGSETGVPVSGGWTEGVNKITHSAILTELLGNEGTNGTLANNCAGMMRDIDGDGHDDVFLTGAYAQYLLSGTASLLTLHPSVYVNKPITSASASVLVVENGLIVCDRTSGRGDCVFYKE